MRLWRLRYYQSENLEVVEQSMKAKLASRYAYILTMILSHRSYKMEREIVNNWGPVRLWGVSLFR